MSQVTFVYYNEPVKMKCECCDRLSMVEIKMIVSKENKLVGDLDLCPCCGEVLMELTAKRKLEKEWSFLGGEGLG